MFSTSSFYCIASQNSIIWLRFLTIFLKMFNPRTSRDIYENNVFQRHLYLFCYFLNKLNSKIKKKLPVIETYVKQWPLPLLILLETSRKKFLGSQMHASVLNEKIRLYDFTKFALSFLSNGKRLPQKLTKDRSRSQANYFVPFWANFGKKNSSIQSSFWSNNVPTY